jgi:hypothetical protein
MVKRANRLMSIIDEIWVSILYTSTKSRYFINDWYLGQIFSLYTCNWVILKKIKTSFSENNLNIK